MKTVPNRQYVLTTSKAATLTCVVNGKTYTLVSATAAGQYSFVALGMEVQCDDTDAFISGPFASAPASALGGGGGGVQRKEFEDHVSDTFVHLSTDNQAQLDYLIRNYGMVPQTPLPTPSENPAEEGDWEYLSDAVLSAYVSDAKMLKPDGTVPVYACLFPWYQQSETNVWSSTECEPELLPDWCNGTPWLFDCLKADGTAKQWRPSTVFETGIDDYQGEYLWTWWNVNYIRANNGNRRITAVEGMDTYKEEGDVDVGVMYAARYCFFDCVD